LVLKINEKSMQSSNRKLFHSILQALGGIEEASRPKARQVVDEPRVLEQAGAMDRA
jgi:hypothetical protein